MHKTLMETPKFFTFLIVWLPIWSEVQNVGLQILWRKE